MATTRSNRQNEVYEFIVQNVRKNGYAPSIREICEAVGLRSTSTVHYHLTALATRGLIEWEGGKNRAIRVIDGVKNPGLPIVGKIAAGRPIEAIAQNDEYLNFEEDLRRPRAVRLEGEGRFDGSRITSPTATT